MILLHEITQIDHFLMLSMVVLLYAGLPTLVFFVLSLLFKSKPMAFKVFSILWKIGLAAYIIGFIWSLLILFL